jgi:putative hydrolase of the HAD superfamily
MSVWADLTSGKISEEQFWDSIQKQSGQTIASEQRVVWKTWNELKPRPAMLKLVSDLRGRGFKVGMLSNVIASTEASVRRHGGYDGFDFTVLSCKVGYSKPDPRVYELALQQLEGIRPEEVVFLDDQERHLAPAKELGMQTILVKSEQQAINDIAALLNM